MYCICTIVEFECQRECHWMCDLRGGLWILQVHLSWKKLTDIVKIYCTDLSWSWFPRHCLLWSVKTSIIFYLFELKHIIKKRYSSLISSHIVYCYITSSPFHIFRSKQYIFTGFVGEKICSSIPCYRRFGISLLKVSFYLNSRFFFCSFSMLK